MQVPVFAADAAQILSEQEFRTCNDNLLTIARNQSSFEINRLAELNEHSDYVRGLKAVINRVSSRVMELTSQFAQEKMELEELVEYKNYDRKRADYLQSVIVEYKKNPEYRGLK